MNRKLNVVILTRIVPIWRKELFEKLQSKSNQFKIEVYFLHSKNAKTIGEHQGINLSSINVTHLKLRRIFKFEYLKKTNRNLKNIKPKVVVVEASPRFLSTYSVFFYKLFRRNIQVVGWSSMYYSTNSLLSILMRKLFHNLFDYFIVYHDKAYRTLRLSYNYRKNIYVVGNSPGDEYIKNEIEKIDSTQIFDIVKKYKAQSKLLALFVGKLTRSKRVDLIIEAASHPIAVDYHFIVIGDGPLKDSLVKQNAIQNHNKNVHFIDGFYEGINAYFQASDVFIMPGTGGMALIQALFNGLPIIGGEADGIGESLIKTDYNGFFNHKFTSDFLLDSLDSLRDVNLLQQMSENSLKESEKYSTRIISEKILGIIKDESN